MTKVACKVLSESQLHLLEAGVLDRSIIPDEQVDLEKVNFEHRQRESFSETDAKRITRLWKEFGQFHGGFRSLEHFAKEFYGEVHLESELRIVEGLADAFKVIVDRHPRWSKRDLVGLLYRISLKSDDAPRWAMEMGLSVKQFQKVISLASEKAKQRQAGPPNPDPSPNQCLVPPEHN